MEYTKSRYMDIISDKFSLNPKVKRNKYLTFCRNNDIPFPDGNARNNDHLNNCQTCQDLWPIYWYFEHIICEQPLEDVFKKWLTLLEDDRIKLLKIGQKLLNSLITEVCSSKMSASVLFTKEQHGKHHSIPFADRSKMISHEWKQLDPLIKQKYEVQSKLIIKDRKEFRSNAPLFIKRKIRENKRLQKNKRKLNNPNPPNNAWIIFVSKKWNRIKDITTLTYQEFLTQSKNEWKSMSQSEKEPYTKQFEQQQSQFKKHKSEIEKKKKLEKNSSSQ